MTRRGGHGLLAEWASGKWGRGRRRGQRRESVFKARPTRCSILTMCWNGVLQVDYDNELDNNKLLGGGMPAWQVRSCPTRTRTAFILHSNSNSMKISSANCVDRTRNPHLSHIERGD